uniref:Uncharacterized protein n=1 Tax=Candidatus Kentrum eta TaxID=2126337 RepID=A0A450UR87_9GAMM|nr:MAG: hypothetical protein BECKH772A_GA0070896_100683 [Candidatus Kentron sp. H]VFJ94995.1 MAG: hypothetical protein BECKH772B_GA0070898_100703 [Candidatus Kentron sp. H]VFK01475.1 MAG: hypothetical protein BECKH772C_GA0070978_100673 [Candidatus Kentron sp. H]
MWEDIRILQEMVKDTARVFIEENPYGKRQVTLGESRDPKDRRVTIAGLPDRAIVIEADKFPSPDAVFHCSKGECKRADFVIVADTGEKQVILCIEMKATKAPEKEIVQQLRGALCFIGYCQGIGRSFWQSPNFLENYQYRFVSIGHIGGSKKRLRISKQKGAHDTPESMLKIHRPGQRLEFKHLM